MSNSYTAQWAVTANSGLVNYTKIYTSSAISELTEAVADSATDLEVTFTLDVSACKVFYLVSDQAVTVETNNGGVPIDTITLVAGVPYLWTTDSYDAFLLGTDVTALFITNSSGSTANIELRALSDSTP